MSMLALLLLLQIQFPSTKGDKNQEASESRADDNSEEKVPDTSLANRLQVSMPERISTGMLRSMIKFLEPVGRYAVDCHDSKGVFEV